MWRWHESHKALKENFFSGLNFSAGSAYCANEKESWCLVFEEVLRGDGRLSRKPSAFQDSTSFLGHTFPCTNSHQNKKKCTVSFHGLKACYASLSWRNYCLVMTYLGPASAWRDMRVNVHGHVLVAKLPWHEFSRSHSFIAAFWRKQKVLGKRLACMWSWNSALDVS